MPRRRSLTIVAALLVTAIFAIHTLKQRSTHLDLDTFLFAASTSALSSWTYNMTDTSSCPFCLISYTYPAVPSHVPTTPDAELITPNCHLLLSTPHVLAFLDILPIAPGHVLVVPREHREKLGHLNANQGAALGAWLPVVSRATMKALGREMGDWNVVQNNGASAAQVVPHVHYHIIPRGGDGVPEIKARSWTMFGRGQREELDDEEGVQIATAIRRELETELQSMKKSDEEGLKLLWKL